MATKEEQEEKQAIEYAAQDVEIAKRIFDNWVEQSPMIRMYKSKILLALANDIGTELTHFRKRIKELESQLKNMAPTDY